MIDEQSEELKWRPAPAPHPLRQFASWFSARLIIGVIVGLLAVEVGIRVIELRTGDMSEPITLATVHADAIADDANRFDLVVIGSSSSGAGIWMDDLEARGVVCDGYVAWLGAPVMSDMLAFVAENFSSGNPPQRVLVAVTMREFLPVESILDPKVGTSGGFVRWTERNLHMVRARPTLQDPFLFALALEQGSPQPLNDDGNQLHLRTRLIVDESDTHRAQEAAAMAQFEIDSNVLDQFATMLDVIAETGATPVVVNLPVAKQFVALAPAGAADYERYIDSVRATTTERGIDLIDLFELGLDERAQFADMNHLNGSGASAVTSALADELEPCAG